MLRGGEGQDSVAILTILSDDVSITEKGDFHVRI